MIAVYSRHNTVYTGCTARLLPLLIER